MLIIKDKEQGLKIKSAELNYGKTQAYAAVIDSGRAKLLTFCKTHDYSLNELEREQLQCVFTENLFTKFSLAKSNAQEVLRYLLNKADKLPVEEIDYRYSF